MADHPSSGKRRATQGSDKGSDKSSDKSRPTGKQRAWRIVRWLVAACLVLALVLVGIAIILYKTIDIPSPNAAFQKQTTFVYYADGNHQVGRFVADNQNRVSLSYDDMPENVKDAVVAAEDRTFWTNNGIDPKGIIRAAFSNARGNATQGASTITQQYVKILYLNQERSYKRKIKEAILSLKIQRQQSKRQILEGYLNTIYFGRGAYGIEAAAHAYFQEPAKELTLRQAAVLASVLNNPYGLDPANGKEAKHALKERYHYVLDGMEQAGDITAKRAAKAEKHLPKFPPVQNEDAFGGQRGHALTLVRKELLALDFSPEQIEGGGLRVTTTLTRKAMTAAEQGVKQAEPKGFSDKQLHVGVAEVEPGTGALRGFYGGQDFLQSQTDWAASGGMTGSAIKPFTLAAALKAGYSLKDTFDGNSPKEFPGVTVHNEGEQAGDYDGHDYGRVSALTATEESINTAYVEMSSTLPHGSADVYDMARAAGIPPAKPDKAYPGIPPTSSADFNPKNFLLTLGNSKVSPINLANAYATIDNGGLRADAHIVQKVTDSNGTVLYRAPQKTERVMPEDVADDVSYALQQTVQHGTGTAALALQKPAAGKTGTATKESRCGGSYVSSSWFVGYTPQLVTSVMYVRGDGDDPIDYKDPCNESKGRWLPSYFGADYPAHTWTAVMQRVTEGWDVLDFPPPAWVDGEAPAAGHSPTPTYTPPPPAPPKPTHSATPTQSPKPPKPTKSPEPTNTPSPTKTHGPPPPTTSTEPTQSPSQSCFPGDPTCNNGNGNKPTKSP